MAVIPKKTSSGKTVYVAKPTQADVNKQVANQRVQTFQGANKLSDTQRVNVGGEWVTPEKAIQTTSTGSPEYNEAVAKQQTTFNLTNKAINELKPERTYNAEIGGKTVTGTTEFLEKQQANQPTTRQEFIAYLTAKQTQRQTAETLFNKQGKEVTFKGDQIIVREQVARQQEYTIPEYPNLTYSDKQSLQEYQANRPIQQTVSGLNDLPDLSYLNPDYNKQYSQINKYEPLVIKLSQSPAQITYINQISNTKNPLKLAQAGIEYVSNYGAETKNKALSLGLVYGGTALKTAWDISPGGIGLSLADKGILGTVQDYNPGNILTAVKEDKLLKNTDPNLRLAEAVGMITGIKLGSKVTESALDLGKKVLFKTQKVVFDIKLKNLKKATPKTDTYFRETSYLNAFPENLQKQPTGAFSLTFEPSMGKVNYNEVSLGKPAIERNTGAVLQETQTQIQPKNIDVYEGKIPEQLSKKSIEPLPKRLSNTLDLENAIYTEQLADFKPGFYTESGAKLSLLPKEIAGKQARLLETAQLSKFGKTESGKTVLVGSTPKDVFNYGNKELSLSEATKDFKQTKKSFIDRIKQKLNLRADITGGFATSLEIGGELAFDYLNSGRSILTEERPFSIRKTPEIVAKAKSPGLLFPSKVNLYEDLWGSGTSLNLWQNTFISNDFKQRQERKYDLMFTPKFALMTKSALNLINLNIWENSTSLDLAQDTNRDLTQEQKRETKSDLMLTPKLGLNLINKGGSDFRGIDFPNDEPTETPQPQLLFFKESEKIKNNNTTELYYPQAKEKGVWLNVSRKPLPENKARNLGAEAVDNTASASFRLKRTNKTSNEQDTPFFNLNSKFTKKGNSYIEKNTFRIDTMGELQGITVKGWLAQRKGGLRI